MYFDEMGDRKNHTIIMLHGAGLPLGFSRQYSLATEYHLVLPHLYGNGEEASKDYTLDKCVEGVLDIIKSLGKDKITIVGFSIGAQLIIPILCKGKAYFDKAILISPWVCKSEKALKSVVESMNQMGSLMHIKWVAKLQAQMVGMNQNDKERFITYCKNTTKENLIAMVKQGVNIEDYNEYRDLKIPMLVLAGSKENEEIHASVKLLQKLNPEYCKIQILEKHGHDIPYNKSQLFNTILLDFLNHK